MRFQPPTTRDRREIVRTFAWVVIPLGVLFAAAVLFIHHERKPVWKILGDPAASMHVNPLLGFFSNLGVIGWCAGASVALFTGWMIVRGRGPVEVARFHLGAGAFTALLMTDDFFLIHDALAPHYLGLPQNAVYAVYAALFAWLVGARRHEILERNPALFILAVGLLGFMAGLDAVTGGRSQELGVLMAGSKFLGIYTWAAWLINAARRDLEKTGSRTD